MFHRLGQLLLIVALLAATGGHWAVLQTVAWTNMLATNLRTDSLEVAVAKTFDGDHPCKLCKEISAGKKAEKKAESPTTSAKFEFISGRSAFIFSAPNEFRLLTALTESLTYRSEAPPTPPPLAA